MKVLVLAAAAFLAVPATASAGASLTMREVPLNGGRTLAAAGTLRFDMVGLHWRGPGRVDFRTRSLDGRWSAWRRAAPEAEDLPDAQSAEARATRGWRLGSPYWTGPSDRIAYRLHGRVDRLRAYFVRSPEELVPPRRLSIASSPALISRLSWGANEAIRKGPVQYAPSVQFAVIHHTAGSNSYTAAQSAAIVRGIEIYHVQGNGWNDIGYNFLVDKYGQVFEGRYGGVDKNVVGAHAEGFNTGSTGIAVLGSYGSAAPPPAARTALANLIAWRLDLAHVDPLSTLTALSGGNPRFPAGIPVTLRAVAGHRDTGFTTCPGDAFYAQLGSIARQAAAAGLPKLYAPVVTGTPGGPVRFQAQLTQPLPWAVTVADASGSPVAGGAGTGQAVDWTWDASGAPPGLYTWTISAGSTVRPATGTLGAKPVPLSLKSVSAAPRTITPNGDGQTDSSTISYTLSTPATVTATLLAPDGRQLSVLFTQQRQAGKQSFKFTATGVPDGRYQIVLSAADGKTTATATVAVLVDRTIQGFALDPRAFSPNGDGVQDDISFRFVVVQPAEVRLDVAQRGASLAEVYSAQLAPGAQTVTWNGAGVKDGTYAALLTASNAVGAVTHTLSFRIDTTPPVLRALSFKRLRFRVSETSVIRLTVNGRTTARTVRAGAFSFRAASVRTVRVSARDAAGNVSRTLRYR
jgi:hypothetical protein